METEVYLETLFPKSIKREQEGGDLVFEIFIEIFSCFLPGDVVYCKKLRESPIKSMHNGRCLGEALGRNGVGK